MVWLPYGEKCFEVTFWRFDRIPACDRQTDGQTDRQTSCYSIVRAIHTRHALKRYHFISLLIFSCLIRYDTIVFI